MNRGIKAAFLISLAGHCLFLRIPIKSLNSSKDSKAREEIFLNIEMKEPSLLPKIDVLGDEKKLKEEFSSLINKDVEPKPLREQELKEEYRDEPFKERVKVNQPSQEAMLRYQDMVKQRIEQARRYPDWARKQGIEGIARVSFIVLATGEAYGMSIIRSSGSRILDAEVIDTIKRASPFAPIPKGAGAYSIQMDVSLVFSLH